MIPRNPPADVPRPTQAALPSLSGHIRDLAASHPMDFEAVHHRVNQSSPVLQRILDRRPSPPSREVTVAPSSFNGR